jgi:hypothetical protein
MNDSDMNDSDANNSDATDSDATQNDDGLSALAKDVSHPFDQTNGIVDGLEGNEDDPETMDEKLDERADGPDGRVAGIPIAGTSGGQPGVAPPPDFGSDDVNADERRNSDTDEPQGP